MALAQCSPWNLPPPKSMLLSNARRQVFWGQNNNIFGKRYSKETPLLKAKSVVPSRDSVPRPVAQVIVAVVGFLALFYVFNSLVSIATFILGIGGLAYIAYIYFNKDSDSSSGPSAGGGGAESSEKSLEEARRIMEKYK